MTMLGRGPLYEFIQMPLDLPQSVLPLFRAAGWPGKNQRFSSQFVAHGHPAAAILRELGGLKVGACGAGEECASSDIAFGFDNDFQQDKVVLQWQKILSTELVNFAEFHHSHGVLLMDASGACYGMSLVHDAFWFEGASFGVAVERCLLGRKSRPMLRPDQSSVSMYGEKFTADHPSVYQYKQAS